MANSRKTSAPPSRSMSRSPGPSNPGTPDDLSDEEFNGSPKQVESLKFDDPQLMQSALSYLNTLRKSGHFCDVTFQVENRTIQAHRAVLACSSPMLYEVFCDEDSSKRQYIKLKHVDYESFACLIDYAYTSHLEVPEQNVRLVYHSAMMLKMVRVVEACSSYMIDHLHLNNCLEVRSVTNSYTDTPLTTETDEYIQNNIEDVLRTSEVPKFPHIQVKVVGEADSSDVPDHYLCQLVVDYFKTNVNTNDERCLDPLTKHPHVLVYRTGRQLEDSADIEDAAVNTCDLVTDYKKLTKRNSGNKQTPMLKTGSDHNMSRSSSFNGLYEDVLCIDPLILSPPEKEWTIIATNPLGDMRSMSVAVLGNQLVTLTISYYPHLPGNTTPPGSCTPSISVTPEIAFVNQNVAPDTPPDRVVLSVMSSPRCGGGTAVARGQLLALGGYDRGECLDTVEAYNLHTNTWSDMPPMLTSRGRFNVTQIGTKLFACGGSNGSQELKSAECYDMETGRWTALRDMSTCRSSAGVATIDGRVYVVGGWSGMNGLKTCEMYDPEKDSWFSIASLHVGRSQSAVCVFEGRLFALGGCDSWISTNSAEMYDPQTDRWTRLPPMVTNRRGCSVAVLRGCLYVVGGSDGQQSLSSVEIYDPTTMTWSFGPSMLTPRVNVATVALGDRMFAVGGFSGKVFLDSIEYFSAGDDNWSCYFTGAGLTGAGLTGAGLTRAGLTGAGMNGAGMNGAGLNGAGMNGAGLTGPGQDSEPEDPLAGINGFSDDWHTRPQHTTVLNGPELKRKTKALIKETKTVVGSCGSVEAEKPPLNGKEEANGLY